MLAPRPSLRILQTCLLGLVLAACEGKPAARFGPAPRGAPVQLALGAPVPEFAGTTLRGDPLSLAESSPTEGTAMTDRRRSAQPGSRKHLTIADVCDELDVARSTFYDWRAKGRARLSA